MDRVTSIEQIFRLADERRSVVHAGSRIPAAVVQNWQARMLHQQILRGTLLVYPKATPRTHDGPQFQKKESR